MRAKVADEGDRGEAGPDGSGWGEGEGERVTGQWWGTDMRLQIYSPR
jgi:hypothetical protein